MIKASFLFLVIALIAVMEFAAGFGVSVIPGWHTVILPPFMVLAWIIITWLCILPVAYFMLERRKSMFGPKLITWHVVLTLFYFLFSNDALYSFAGEFITHILPVIFFAAGQVIFLVGFVKAIR